MDGGLFALDFLPGLSFFLSLSLHTLTALGQLTTPHSISLPTLLANVSFPLKHWFFLPLSLKCFN